MPIVHVVLFGFKSTASKEDILKVCDNMLGLAKECIHPTTKAPYIRSATGGKNNSPEGFQGDSTHAFVMWFDSVEDRDYYVKDDPTHQAFAKSATSIIGSVRVVDFETGAF